VLSFATGAGDVPVFAVSALALIPLAWLIGEATEHLGEHTGPGIGGFLNASFGNAPELIISVFAVRDGLPNVVRGSIMGSVVSNLLLVLGATMIAGAGVLDRRSLLLQLATIGAAVVLFLVPSIPGWEGDPDRHSLYVSTLVISVALLAIYAASTLVGLRRHRAMHRPAATEHAWAMRTSILVLSAAATATAFVSEGLVGSLEGFGDALGLSEFFVAAVIVAIVGNAAEHGGAVVVARRGKTKLASEIAISSAAQVAVFVAPAVALLSAIGGYDLTLSFRPIEIAAMALSTLLVTWCVVDGRSSHREGVMLLGGYAVAVVLFLLAGNR
jgi:Ca2+:H+ antiporter